MSTKNYDRGRELMGKHGLSILPIETVSRRLQELTSITVVKKDCCPNSHIACEDPIRAVVGGLLMLTQM